MLGKVEQVYLRSIWKHEASDFTYWLAEPENCQALADKDLYVSFKNRSKCRFIFCRYSCGRIQYWQENHY